MFGYISHYEGMETGDIVARVVEGRVNKVNVVQVDDEGGPRKGPGEVAPEIILRELPFKVRRPMLSLAPSCCSSSRGKFCHRPAPLGLGMPVAASCMLTSCCFRAAGGRTVWCELHSHRGMCRAHVWRGSARAALLL